MAVPANHADIKLMGDIRAATSSDHGPSHPGLVCVLPSRPYEQLSQPNMTDSSCKESQETHNKLTGQSETTCVAHPS